MEHCFIDTFSTMNIDNVELGLSTLPKVAQSLNEAPHLKTVHTGSSPTDVSDRLRVSSFLPSARISISSAEFLDVVLPRASHVASQRDGRPVLARHDGHHEVSQLMFESLHRLPNTGSLTLLPNTAP